MGGARVTNEALAARIDAIKEYNSKQFSDIMTAIGGTNENISKLNIKVGIQNGNVKQLQEDRAKHASLIEEIARTQATCPGRNLADEYHSDKDKNMKNPVTWLVNNWLPVIIIAAVVATVFMLFPGLLLRVWSIVSGTQLEIGI